MNKIEQEILEQMDEAYAYFVDACIAELLVEHAKARGIPLGSRVDEMVTADEMFEIVAQAETMAEKTVRETMAETEQNAKVRFGASAVVMPVWKPVRPTVC